MTIVGNVNVVGYTGDGRLAVDASVDGPTSVYADKFVNLCFADSINQVVRKMTGNQQKRI